LCLAIDWVAACFAFLLEKKEHWRLVWWLFLQRFCYRQVMYYVMSKSVAVAARATTGGWGKLDRKATVEAQPSAYRGQSSEVTVQIRTGSSSDRVLIRGPEIRGPSAEVRRDGQDVLALIF